MRQAIGRTILDAIPAEDTNPKVNNESSTVCRIVALASASFYQKHRSSIKLSCVPKYKKPFLTCVVRYAQRKRDRQVLNAIAAVSTARCKTPHELTRTAKDESLFPMPHAPCPTFKTDMRKQNFSSCLA